MLQRLGFPGFEDAGPSLCGVTRFLSHLEHSHPLPAPILWPAEVKVVPYPEDPL